MRRHNIKTIALITATILTCIAIFVSCNKVEGSYQYFDTTWSFDYAMLTMPNGDIVEGKLESWRDYEDGDQLQVKINNKTYLVHSSNVVLVRE